MKRSYLTIAILLIFTMAINSQTWKLVSTPTEQTATSSYFLSAKVGWYVGAKGLIKKTVDGGKTWSAITTSITEDLKTVYFLDANNGFAASLTKLYKSTDGFATYTSSDITGALTSTSYNGLYFANSQVGYVLSSSSSAAKIIRTADGGATWTVVLTHTSNLQTFTMYNATSGIAAGGGVGKCDIFYTTDGTTWTKGTTPTWPATPVYTRNDIKGLYMLSKDVAYGIGWGSLVGAQASIYIQSLDGGKTWTYLPQTDANKVFENMYDIYFKDPFNGLAVGGGTKTSVLTKTVDGGANWVPISVPSGAQLSKISGFGDNVIITTGSGSFLSSSDFGNTWTSLTQIPSATINSIYAVNNNVIYAGGQDGLVLKSIDGGKTWNSLCQTANMATPSINGIFFTNENVGYTSCSYSMVGKTIDGGKTWTAIKKDSTAATSILYGVHFLNANQGWFVGKDSTNIDLTYITSNGGTSTTRLRKVLGTNLRGVAFYDASNGITVGEKLKAYYSKDGGKTWTASTISGVPTASASATLREVTYINATTAVAVGDKLILRSTDGGVTFTYLNITDLAHSMTGVASLGNTVWAVGAKTSSPKGMAIYQSVDGGLTWVNKADPSVIDSLTTIYDITIAPNGSVYVCGTKSTIYTNANIPNGIESDVIPSNFTLEQNYPNPFNPETTIKYQISAQSQVSLIIYDVLGREVTKLVNEIQKPGAYSVNFNAVGSSLSSGVYFYKLKAGNFVQTKKMMLIK